MHPIELRTPRLVLRAPTMGDVEEITAACQDVEIARWTTVPSPYTRSDAETFVDRVAGWWADGADAVWAVFCDEVFAGMVGLHRISAHPDGGDAEIGFWLVSEARSRGLLAEAADAVIDWAFVELGLARITWRAVVGNVRSARSARALGFRYEGLQRQALTSPRGRDDGWVAGLLREDDRTPVAWPIALS